MKICPMVIVVYESNTYTSMIAEIGLDDFQTGTIRATRNNLVLVEEKACLKEIDGSSPGLAYRSDQ